ncbi:Protein FAR1-RELATED SEQUENCE 5 [Hordeum vulgare]|nr:Protein FAR1-RELATED SEQUENCE 5 [Hordeum vulgare]
MTISFSEIRSAWKVGIENTRSCRCECPALIRLLRADDNGWYIAEHRDTHNHSLSPKYGETMHWPSHKRIDVYTSDLVKKLRENNVNLAKVYIIVGGFFGSMENVPFTKRLLHTLCGQINRDHAEDDVRKTMDVFAEIRAKDPQFTYKVEADSEEEIEKHKTYVAIHSEAEKMEKWCRVSYKVTMLDCGQEFDYECDQFAHMGLLCSHVLEVLDFIRAKEIPAKHIVKRWMKDARDV